MEYQPRYPQPFTLAQAIALDVATITGEIARLQDSLRRLHETQTFLRQHIAEEADNADIELINAVEENNTVIGSQEERISILKMALTEKGVLSGSQNHYVSQETSTAPNRYPPIDLPLADDQSFVPTAHPTPDEGLDL